MNCEFESNVENSIRGNVHGNNILAVRRQVGKNALGFATAIFLLFKNKDCEYSNFY